MPPRDSAESIYAFVGGGLGQLTGEVEIESSESLSHPNAASRLSMDADHGEADECSNRRCVAFEVASQTTVTTTP